VNDSDIPMGEESTLPHSCIISDELLEAVSA
jgi:hypothetical protein